MLFLIRELVGKGFRLGRLGRVRVWRISIKSNLNRKMRTKVRTKMVKNNKMSSIVMNLNQVKIFHARSNPI